MQKSPLAAAIWLASLSLIAHAQGLAAEEKKEYLGEMVVTATKTGETDLQETPIAITALDSQQLEERGIQSIDDLSHHVPGLSVSQNTVFGRVYMRGVGSNLDFVGADMSVATYLDGVYLGRSGLVFDDFLDVERIEVLRGPQGTLYGRNAAGGAINVISKLPEAEPEGQVSVEYGSFATLKTNARISGPVAGDNILGSLALLKADSGGYVRNDNPATGEDLADEDTLGARGVLRFIASDRLEARLSADYKKFDESGDIYKQILRTPTGGRTPVYSSLPVPPEFIEDSHVVNLSNRPFVEREDGGLSAHVDWDVSDGFTINSITAYRWYDLQGSIDTDWTLMPVRTSNVKSEEQYQFSQELQFTGNIGSVEWLLGMFYMTEQHDWQFNIHIFSNGLDLDFDTSNETTTYGTFGQVAFGLTDQLTATLGARYSWEEKDFDNHRDVSIAIPTLPDFDQTAKEDWEAFTPRAGLDYKISSDAMLYAFASKGFKSGGFNASTSDPAFDPEELWAYEIGMKSEWFNKKLRTNVALFYYDYEDLQVQSFTQNNQTIVTNASDATVQGIELELGYKPTFNWEFGLNLAWLDATYDRYLVKRAATDPDFIDVSDNRLNSAPKWKTNSYAAYFQDVEGAVITYRLDYFWQSEEYYTAFNDPLTMQKSYGLVNAKIAYETNDEKWKVEVFGENLNDKVYTTATQDFSLLGVAYRIMPPRTLGVKVTRRF